MKSLKCLALVAAIAAGLAPSAQGAVDPSLACADNSGAVPREAKARWRNVDMFITTFGCYPREDGKWTFDRDDNCHPGCFEKVCTAEEKRLNSQTRNDLPQWTMDGSGGKKVRGYYKKGDIACEGRIKYFVADSQRFGCGTKVKVTNPANGASVVAMVVDAGPQCRVERKAKGPILDSSGMVNTCLFGSHGHGAGDRARVQVEVVSASTPLGPAGQCASGAQRQANAHQEQNQERKQEKKQPRRPARQQQQQQEEEKPARGGSSSSSDE
jgi:hypothetical protein